MIFLTFVHFSHPLLFLKFSQIHINSQIKHILKINVKIFGNWLLPLACLFNKAAAILYAIELFPMQAIIFPLTSKMSWFSI